MNPLRKRVAADSIQSVPRKPGQQSGPTWLQPKRMWAWLERLAYLASCAFILAANGCALHYYDRDSGTEHLWGFGHMKMRAVPRHDDETPMTNAVVAFVTGVRTAGLNLGVGSEFAGVVAGWDSRSRIIIRSEDSEFYLLWPTNAVRLPQDLKDIFTVRVGTDCPFTNGIAAIPMLDTNQSSKTSP